MYFKTLTKNARFICAHKTYSFVIEIFHCSVFATCDLSNCLIYCELVDFKKIVGSSCKTHTESFHARGAFLVYD